MEWTRQHRKICRLRCRWPGILSIWYTFFPAQSNIQMIIHIPFTENVRLRSVLLKIGISPPYMHLLAFIYGFKAGAISLLVTCGYTPTTTLSSILSMQRVPILYSTSPCSRVKSVWQNIPSALQHSPMFIPFPSFSCVQVHRISKLLIWSQNSVGEDTSRLYYIGFKGDVRSAKHAAHSLLDVPTPNTGDAKLIDRLSEKAAGQQTTAR